MTAMRQVQGELRRAAGKHNLALIRIRNQKQNRESRIGKRNRQQIGSHRIEPNRQRRLLDIKPNKRVATRREYECLA